MRGSFINLANNTINSFIHCSFNSCNYIGEMVLNSGNRDEINTDGSELAALVTTMNIYRLQVVASDVRPFDSYVFDLCTDATSRQMLPCRKTHKQTM